MSEDNTVSGGDSEENTTETIDSESKTPAAGDGEQPKTPEADNGEGDKAKAFDETLLDTEVSTVTPPTAEVKTDAAFNASKKIETFFDRVANGKINPTTGNEWSLDDIDEVWVKNAVSDKLGDLNKKPEQKVKNDEVDVYERIKYDQLVESIPELPESKQKTIANLVKELQEEGVTSKFKALKRALDISNIELEAENRGKKAALMGAGGGGAGGGVNVKAESVDPEFMKKSGLTKEKLKKMKTFDFTNPSANA